jgi:hypothetical protein
VLIDIKDLAVNGARLVGVSGYPYDENHELNGFEKIKLEFEGGNVVILGINDETDELIYLENTNCEDTFGDLVPVIPSVGHAVDMRISWAWEMMNHQGYFDALQMQFSSSDLKESEVLQFKVASFIWIFSVKSITGCGRGNAQV